MTEILIVFYSRQGATAELARHAARGVESVAGCSATLRTVPPVSAENERPVKAVPDAVAPYATLIAVSVSLTTYLMSLSVAVDASQRAHDFMLQAVPTLVSTIAFMLLYKLVPHRRVQWRHALVGAVTASLLFEGAKELFAVYDGDRMVANATL